MIVLTGPGKIASKSRKVGAKRFFLRVSVTEARFLPICLATYTCLHYQLTEKETYEAASSMKSTSPAVLRFCETWVSPT